MGLTILLENEETASQPLWHLYKQRKYAHYGECMLVLEELTSKDVLRCQLPEPKYKYVYCPDLNIVFEKTDI